MKKFLTVAMAVLMLAGCGPKKDDGRTYVSKHNYYMMEKSKGGTAKGWAFTGQVREFPVYYVYRAKEWPREDLNDASSYDLPRVEFFWANLAPDDPHYTKYEGQDKIWSMKTDGTDLRLVTDNAQIRTNGRGKMARQPNNRYLAYSRGAFGNAVYDLKTHKTYVLNSELGPVGFLWAEDSSYLYYRTSVHDVYKWDVKTHQQTKVEFRISDTGVIYNGQRVIVSDFALNQTNENDGQREKVISWARGLGPVSWSHLYAVKYS